MFGNNVSSLIANQSAMDLCSCFFYTVTIVLQMTKAYIMQIYQFVKINYLNYLHGWTSFSLSVSVSYSFSCCVDLSILLFYISQFSYTELSIN